ncbi:MAG: hypothetical protein WBQ43_12715 [Terriglobales bacterium]
MTNDKPTAAKYYRALTDANEKYGWSEIPDGCPMEFFAQMMAVRQQEHPEAAVHRIEYRMKWFKHMSDLRRSPGMLFVSEHLGDYGVAGVYRLYELFAQRFGVNDDFSGSILLQPPYTERWLAQEILTPNLSQEEAEEYCRDVHEVPLEQLNRFLQVCVSAGFLEITTQTGKAVTTQNDGTTASSGEHTWRRLTIPGFAELKDDWASHRRPKGRALSTPE